MAGENNQNPNRCFKHRAEDGPSLFQNGTLVFQTHHVGWIIASTFTIIATAVSAWLISKHLKWYTNKHEQRHIVRILFMPPIYAIVSTASFFFWNNATPLILLRDCYESTVLTSFFYLLLYYINPNSEEQRVIFRKVGLSREADNETLRKGEEIKKWVFPLGFVKWKPADGLYFLQYMKWGVLQYCVLRPLTTFAAVILDYIGLYCEDSWSPGWGHIYLVVIVSLSVTIAMYCLIQLYVVSSEYLAPQRPLLKLFAIKAVVFLTFWQATFLSVLSMFGVVKDTKYMTAEDINIGIGALLETFEMTLFAFLHVKAFTYKVYKPMTGFGDLPSPTNRWRALRHAMDFRETFRELWAGCVYMWAKIRGREPEVDVGARRQGYYENAFGRARPTAFNQTPTGDTQHRDCDDGEKEPEVSFPSVRVDVERQVDVGGRREWLGAGEYYGYGIYREKSDGLEEQIELELARRGYGRTEIGKRGNIKYSPNEEVGHPRQRSWWRSLYNRVSQSAESDQESRLSPPPSRKVTNSKRRLSRRSSRNPSRDRDVERDLLADYHLEMDDPPPPSLIRTYRASTQRSHSQQCFVEDGAPHRAGDVLSPLSGYNEHRHSKLQRQQQRRNTSPPSAQVQMPSPRPVDGRAAMSPPPVLGSSPPPTSLLLSPVGHNNLSKDSLMGRVFPSKTDLVSSTEHTDGGFMTSPPPSAENGHGIGMAGQRQTPQTRMVPSSIIPDVVVHRYDSEERHSRHSPPRNRISMPPSTRAFDRHRSSAYVSQQRLSGPSLHRQSLPPPGPSPSHKRNDIPLHHPPLPDQGRRFTPKVLTVPAPLASTPRKEKDPPGPGYDPERMDSTIAQPSYSGAMNAGKYPAPVPITPGSYDIEDLGQGSGRYPGLPSRRDTDLNRPATLTSPTSPTRPMKKPSYTNHHFPSDANNDHYAHESSRGFGMQSTPNSGL